jgi:AcrR family transcriptional regulator
MSGRGRAPSEATAPHTLTAGNGLARGRLDGVGRGRVSEIQRGRMLAALVEVVNERGVANVTVADIVGRSGVSRRTFYEMFDDREDCLLAAFEDALHRIAVVVIPAYAQPVKWQEKIRAGLTAFLGFLDNERATGRLVIVESAGAGNHVLERRERVLERTITAIDQGRTEAKHKDPPPPVAAEGILGGVLSILHTRLSQDTNTPLLELTGPLMSMIVLPYLGPAAARKELQRPTPQHHPKPPQGPSDPLRDIEMRLTYRTVRVLTAIAELGGRGSYPSNRQVGEASGMQDQGQISKLLARLHRLGLIHNTGIGPTKGAPNAWTLTPTGNHIQQTIQQQTHK